MKGMILAAGLGKRMRPLSNQTPKPLIKVGGQSLIEYRIHALIQAGIKEIAINTSYLAEQFKQHLGDGQRFGATLHYIYEGQTPLNTGGAIINALDFFDNQAFIVTNGDVFSNEDLSHLKLPEGSLAHLLMVSNPAHRPNGDFYLNDKQYLALEGKTRLTFSGIAVYHPKLFIPYSNQQKTNMALIDILLPAIKEMKITAERTAAFWADIGTPKRLKDLEQYLKNEVK